MIEEGEFTSCAEFFDDWFNSCNVQGVAHMETCEVEELLEEMRRIEGQTEWVPIADFESTAYEGQCWIVYKGRVTLAYRNHKRCFMFSRVSGDCFMTECISYVMPLECPEPPIGGTVDG